MTETKKSPVTKAQVRYAIKDGIVDGDGHGIYPASIFLDAGFDCGHLEIVFKSDTSDHKDTIFDSNGNVLEELKGISSLRFLYWLADQCGVEYASKMGRGSQARSILSALSEWANSPDEEEVLLDSDH